MAAGASLAACWPRAADARTRGRPGGAAFHGWIRPGPDDRRPIWGIRGGIQVALWPASVEGPGEGGPRGLLRLGYPILDGGKAVGLVNFIAVEPIVKGRRGFSELEKSDTDGRPGRIFWTGEGVARARNRAAPRLDRAAGIAGHERDAANRDHTPYSAAHDRDAASDPDPGELRTVDGVERLAVCMRTERFANGAQVIVDLELRADRPGELRLTASSAPGSAPMETCVLTATMGNYGRLRRLWLRGGPVESQRVWPDFTGREFTPEAFFPSSRMRRMPGGDLLVCATTDEEDPHAVPPDPAGPGWAYRGSFPLTQYWRKPVDGSDVARLRVRVNGRRVYWATHNPIPGGLAFENFDLVQPFTERQSFIFGLTRRSPAEVAAGKP